MLDRAKKIAAHLLEASADDIVVGDGGLHVAGVPSKSISWADLAAASKDASKLPADVEAGHLAPRTRLRRHRLDLPVRCPRLGCRGRHRDRQVDMLRHIAVDDCGRILNPMLVAGQQHGGIAQGAAQALYEWVQYDADGNPVTSQPHRLRHPVSGRTVQLRNIEHPDRQPP